MVALPDSTTLLVASDELPPASTTLLFTTRRCSYISQRLMPTIFLNFFVGNAAKVRDAFFALKTQGVPLNFFTPFLALVASSFLEPHDECTSHFERTNRLQLIRNNCHHGLKNFFDLFGCQANLLSHLARHPSVAVVARVITLVIARIGRRMLVIARIGLRWCPWQC